MVKKEMVCSKGLAEESADKIGTYVAIHGSAKETLAKLQVDPSFSTSTLAKEAFADLTLLFDYLDSMGALQYLSFDLSLARGLDYYTGVIYEAMLTDTDRVGSIAAGGRYDTLVGMFSNKQVPAVGVSIGIERILTILEENAEKAGKIRKNQTQVLVSSIGANLLSARMSLCRELWSAGICAEFLYDLDPKPKKQLDVALEQQIPFMIWIGEEELKKGLVKLKNMVKKTEIEVSRDTVVEQLKKQIDEQ
jgi:histidyl-tRNA synthetase